MAESVNGLVLALTEEASIDISAATALVYINRAWRTFHGRARSYRDTVSFGTVVADQAAYAAPAGIKELYSLEVAGVPYGRARRPDGYSNSQGRLYWSFQGEVGLFYNDATASSVEEIVLIPTPTEAGAAITGFAATLPPDLTNDGTGDTLLTAHLDGDMIEPLIAGGMAIAYQREGNLALRDACQSAFDASAEEYRRTIKRRFRGPGPTQMRIGGAAA